MTSKNEPDSASLKQVQSLEAGIRRIDMRDYAGLCNIGYHEPSKTYFWTWDNWGTKHGPFTTATEAFLSWEKCRNKSPVPTRSPEPGVSIAPVPTLDPTRWKNRGTSKPGTVGEPAPTDGLAGAKQECKVALGRVIVRQAYPGAKVSHIAGSTYRVSMYEQTAGIVPVNKLTYSFLVDVIGESPIRRPEASKKLSYSTRW